MLLMAERKKPIASNKPNRNGVALNVYLPEKLMEAFEAYCRENRRSKTAQVEIALERMLESEGRWPVDDDE